MEAQFQIRQNAMEMQEYLKDLFDWQKSIRKREKTVAATSAATGSGSDTPAPRGRAGGAVAPAPAELMRPALGPDGPRKASSGTVLQNPASSAASQQTAAPGDRTAAAHTYSSYSKWDRFDVDAALASDDEDNNSKANDNGSAASTNGRSSKAASAAAAPPPAAAELLPVAPPSAPPAAPAPPIAPTPPLSSSTISITTRDPTQPQEDHLRPVSTTITRPTQPPATAPTHTPAQEPSLPPIRNSQPTKPDAWRTRGNDLFKAGEYDSAIECYSRSLELQPTCLAHANRAMALLKLSRWQEAVHDCTAAVQLDPLYVKAYQRRAAAYRQLGKLLESSRDWEMALRLEPENKAVASDRDATLEGYLREEKLSGQQQQQQPLPRRAVAVKLPVGAQSVGVPAGATVQGQTSGGAAPAGSEQDGNARGTVAVSGAPGVKAATAPTAGSVTQGSAGTAAAAGEAPEPGDQPIPATADHAAAAVAATTAATPPAAAPPAPAPPTPAAAAPTPAAAAAAAAVAAAAAAAASSSVGVRPPKNSVEFEAAWRSMASDPHRQATYLLSIPPATLPAVFKNSLTSPVLSAILRCLLSAMAVASSGAEGGLGAGSGEEGQQQLQRGVELLRGLTSVARFDMLVMGVPSKERAALREAWEGLAGALAAAGADGGLRGELEGLRAKYRL